MSRFKITFAVSAVEDLEEIRQCYTDQHLPETGERLIREILRHVEQLEEYPKSGRVVPEFSMTALREIIHPPFRIVYRLEKKRVRVVRVWRSERLLKLQS